MNHAARKFSAVIFDLDGTLVDSEPLYLEADQKIFRPLGIIVDAEHKKPYTGLSSHCFLADIKKQYSLSLSVEELLLRKNAAYMELAQERTHVFPEMRTFVNLLKEHGYPLAVASGSSKEVIDAVLEAADLRNYFDVTLSSAQVKHGKPAPDVFLEAARLLKKPPQSCLVMEDSRYGVEAAKQAQMSCIAIPPAEAAPLADCFYEAELLFAKGMDEFTAAEAFAWLHQ
nr:HAD family phosphatase [uncultured Anaeromusa sp.]